MNYRKIKINDKEALLGRDESQNEKLVKEFIGKNNIMMHTVARGSPFGVALNELNAAEKRKLANCVASYSQDWRDNKKNIRVHVFTGKDVRKGKLMKIGTFGVKKAKVIIAKKGDIEKCRK